MKRQRIEPWQAILVMFIALGIFLGVNSIDSYSPSQTLPMLTPTPIISEIEMIETVSRIQNATDRAVLELRGCSGVVAYTTNTGDTYLQMDTSGGMLVLTRDGGILHSQGDNKNTLMEYPIRGEINGVEFDIPAFDEVCPYIPTTPTAVADPVAAARLVIEQATPDPLSDCDMNGVESAYDFYKGPNGETIMKKGNVTYVVFPGNRQIVAFEGDTYAATIPLPTSFVEERIKVSFDRSGGQSCYYIQETATP